jgi:hypothetical protein
VASIVSGLIRVPCTVHHINADGGADEYGNPTVGETVTDERCWLAQQVRNEPATDNVLLEAERWAMYFESSVVLDASDRVDVLGETYEVVGPPWPVRDPLFPNRVDHIEATVERRQ